METTVPPPADTETKAPRQKKPRQPKKPATVNPHYLENHLRSISWDAADGHPQAIEQIRWHLGEHPELVAKYGNLARDVEEKLIRSFVGMDMLRQESIVRENNKLRLELTGPNPVAIEVLLVDHIVQCHLVSMLANYRASWEPEDSKQAVLLVREAGAAQRRFHAAVRELYRVRGRGRRRRSGETTGGSTEHILRMDSATSDGGTEQFQFKEEPLRATGSLQS